MKKKLGMTLALILVAATGAYSSVPRPAFGTAVICPELPANCCQFKIAGGCLVCSRTCE